MSGIRVKICGTTTPQDGLLAAQAGADALGLIFAPGSKRQITPPQARNIALSVGPTVARVGVFMHQGLDEILRVADAARLSSVQLHGAQSQRGAQTIAQYYPVLLALSVHDLNARNLSNTDLPLPSAALTWLIDAPQPGSGQPIDWAALAPHFPAGAWLAGGLGPENVAQAITTLRPAGVDAVTRLECQPGVKDPALVRAFVRTAHQAAQVFTQSYPQ